MKILLLATHLNLGGIGIYTTSLAVQLKALGNEVIIASSGGELAEDIKQKGITHIDIPVNTSADIGFHTFISYLKLLPVIRDKSIDIIHAQTRVTQIIAYMLSGKGETTAEQPGIYGRLSLQERYPPAMAGGGQQE